MNALKELLARVNYDDRAEPIGRRHRDIAGAALEDIGRRTIRGRFLPLALRNLPPANV